MAVTFSAIKLSREELHQLVADYQATNDDKLLEKVIQGMLKLCIKLARKFCIKPCYEDECISEALIGVVEAARTYEVNNPKNICFTTYATKCSTNFIFKFLKYYHWRSIDAISIDEPIYISPEGSELLIEDILTYEPEEDSLTLEEDKALKKIQVFMNTYFSDDAIMLMRNKFGFNNTEPLSDRDNAKALGLTYEAFRLYYRRCLRAIRSHLKSDKHPDWRI